MHIFITWSYDFNGGLMWLPDCPNKFVNNLEVKVGESAQFSIYYSIYGYMLLS